MSKLAVCPNIRAGELRAASIASAWVVDAGEMVHAPKTPTETSPLLPAHRSTGSGLLPPTEGPLSPARHCCVVLDNICIASPPERDRVRQFRDDNILSTYQSSATPIIGRVYESNAACARGPDADGGGPLGGHNGGHTVQHMSAAAAAPLCLRPAPLNGAETYDAPATYSQRLVGWLLLCTTVVSFALMAPVTKMVPMPHSARLVASTLVSGWRLAWAALLLTPVSAVWLWHYGLGPHQRALLRERAAWRSLLLCGSCCGLNAFGYNTSLAYTTIPQAVICMNLHPLMIILYRLCRVQPVQCGELLGVALAMLGMGFIAAGAMLSNAGPAGRNVHRTLLWDMLRGDMAGLIGAATVCLFLTETRRVRNHLPVVLVLNVQLAVGAVVMLGGAWLVLGARLSSDVWDGLCGFVHPIYATSVCLGGALGLGGWFGANGVTKYLNPIVIATFMTLEPACAFLLGVLMGVEAFPNLDTCAGICIMFAATTLVSARSFTENDGKLVNLQPHAMCNVDPSTQRRPISAAA